MTTRKNIFAFTKDESFYPGYISVNGEADGHVSITIRSSADGLEAGATASIKLTSAQADALIDSLVDYLNDLV